MSTSWTAYLAKAPVVSTYTKFAANETASSFRALVGQVKSRAKESGREWASTIDTPNSATGEVIRLSYARIKELSVPSNVKVIPHGVDVSSFHVMDPEKARAYFDLPDPAFIVLNVSRNQPRKRLDLCIRGFSYFAKDKPHARLVLHCWGENLTRWNLRQLAQWYGVEHQVVLIHDRFPSLYDWELNALYNAADVFVNTSGGEGWGLPLMEAAACVKPVIVPDWSATAEIWKGAGLLTPTVSVFHELQEINTMQCVIDDNSFACQLQQLHDDELLRQKVAQNCFAITQRPEYSWDLIAAQFDKYIQRAAEAPTVESPKILV